jgi:hypothetical protein
MIIAPHLAASDIYHKFYLQNKNLYTIIDNGLWEGEVVSNEELLSWANILECDEIIAPDNPSGAETIRLTKQFIAYIKKEKQRDMFIIHGVAHGDELIEATKCIDELMKLNVDIIDLPKMLGPHAREILKRYARKKYLDTPIHYLGFYKDEAESLSKASFEVRSFDSSVPFKPNYKDKFNLHLPNTWRNRFRITRNVNKFKNLYYVEGISDALSYC